MNLNINEEEIKKCFEKYDEEIDFETFKKLILEPEQEEKNMKESNNNSNNITRNDIRKRSNRSLNRRRLSTKNE